MIQLRFTGYTFSRTYNLVIPQVRTWTVNDGPQRTHSDRGLNADGKSYVRILRIKEILGTLRSIIIKNKGLPFSVMDYPEILD